MGEEKPIGVESIIPGAAADGAPLVSVIMPTFGQAAFIRRAIESLLAQTMESWELVIVDDGSPDGTGAVVADYRADPRIRYRRLEENVGLGAALNDGLERSRADLVAYLPSDDVFYGDHLARLTGALDRAPDAVLAYSGVRHHYNRTAPGQIPGYPLQLVQVAHRRTADRWTERGELTTDDLDRMLWSRLRERGRFLNTDAVTCEWVDHPTQRHKVMQEPLGGLNPYRARYHVRRPLLYHSTAGNATDEVSLYQRFRERPDTPPSADGLTILLVGELAYNAERILALEERGHKLYGLWTPEPSSINTVGPLPFGHVEDIAREGWIEAVRTIKPDIIYALLNWQTVPFAYHVLRENPGVPFIWHFKEGPFICLEKGTWAEMVALHTESDGQIYCSPEMREWFQTVVPGADCDETTLILDGDLPKHEWFVDGRKPLLSAADGAIHTVVTGRPIGLHPETVGELAAENVHLHFYGDFVQGQWHAWIDRATALAPDHLHLHPNVDQRGWASEFSQYDAGWLHFFKSENDGEIRRATWDDLNLPARIATYAAAGLPTIQADNTGAVVATQSLVRTLGIGVLATDMRDVAAQLRERERMAQIRADMWRLRTHFTFDSHADRLIAFFRSIISRREGR
ncbi:MAG TPA: glycosyltransferase [Chloroflexota bacterium]|nr:glycosyltransferase [Chloroflexota bacterium]